MIHKMDFRSRSHRYSYIHIPLGVCNVIDFVRYGNIFVERKKPCDTQKLSALFGSFEVCRQLIITWWNPNLFFWKEIKRESKKNTLLN